MNASLICRRAVPALGAACLVVGGIAIASPIAVADSSAVQFVAGPDSSLPVPSYRPGPKGSNVPPPEKSTEEESPRYYTDCDQVRAEGKLPLYRGQPGYNPYLDPDGDGIACD
ncbi:excalibur calcium-binding domain-containing protein [Nocardia pseudovaccinii]|uniref:excalibur calcium-binding domain-containing protein n=1 Tax=Nocardia pseudovaccinii TaxID=189540 RepID=UPI000A6868CB|nr:excalibur calcium-binding domain-containing protein [Nocardia pseudovaccinii]